MPGLTTPLADSAQDQVSEVIDGGQDGAHYPGAGEHCDLFAQDCADPAAPKCRVDYSDPSYVVGICDALLGSAGNEEECERPTGQIGIDTCDKGLYCSYLGVAYSDPQKRVCRPLCDRSSMCDADEKCTVINQAVGAAFPDDMPYVGYCAPSGCSLFDAASCDAGLKCVDVAITENEPAFVCVPSAGLTKGTACTTAYECAGGMGCMTAAGPDHNTCQPYCDSAHATCDPGQTCTVLDLGASICQTVPDA